MLCIELATEEKPLQVRQLAGLIMKNALTAKVSRLLLVITI
jgi:hypothetical protein